MNQIHKNKFDLKRSPARMVIDELRVWEESWNNYRKNPVLNQPMSADAFAEYLTTRYSIKPKFRNHVPDLNTAEEIIELFTQIGFSNVGGEFLTIGNSNAMLKIPISNVLLSKNYKTLYRDAVKYIIKHDL